jgi:hypothetical protein
MNWLVDCYVETFVRTMLFWHYLPAYITDYQVNQSKRVSLENNQHS